MISWFRYKCLLGAIAYQRPVALCDRLRCFIEQAVYLSLEPITGHYGGIVRRRRRLVHQLGGYGAVQIGIALGDAAHLVFS